MVNMDRSLSPLQATSVGTAVALGCLLLFDLMIPGSSPGYSINVPNSGLDLHTLTALANYPFAGVLFVAGYVTEAVSNIEREEEQLTTERDAFYAFTDDIRTVSVPVQQSVGVTAVQLAAPSAGEDQLRTVRNAYRETVMSVPHYDEEYGEALRKNMAAELDEDLATMVVDGTRFSKPLKQLLVQHARTAARQREEVIEAINEERDSIVDAHSRLQAIDVRRDRNTEFELLQESFSELVDLERDLRQSKRRCEQVLDDRQHDIHRVNREFQRSARPSLQQYLYADLEVTFPVLTVTLERIRQLHDQQRAVTRQIGRRY